MEVVEHLLGLNWLILIKRRVRSYIGHVRLLNVLLKHHPMLSTNPRKTLH
jgi:hypothetical protein